MTFSRLVRLLCAFAKVGPPGNDSFPMLFRVRSLSQVGMVSLSRYASEEQDSPWLFKRETEAAAGAAIHLFKKRSGMPRARGS